MSRLVRRLVAPPQVKRVYPSAIVGGTRFAAGAWSLTPWNWRAYLDEGYCANPYVYGAIESIGKCVASLSWLLYQRDRVDNLEELSSDHDLLQLLARPSRWFGQAAFFRQLVRHILVTGAAHIVKQRPGARELGEGRVRGIPRELHVVLAGDITPIRAKSLSEPISSWQFGGNPLPLDDVTYARLPHPADPIMPFSPLIAAARAIDQSNELANWNFSLLRNSARPSGVFTVEGNLDEEAFRHGKEEIAGQTQGGKLGTPLLLEGGAKWQQISHNPDDMHWWRLSVITAREIAMVLDYPSVLLGDVEAATYSNMREARRAVWELCAIPVAEFLRDELNAQLVPEFGEDLYLDIDKTRVQALQEAEDLKWERLGKAVDRGILDVDEARDELGYEARGEAAVEDEL